MYKVSREPATPLSHLPRMPRKAAAAPDAALPPDGAASANPPSHPTFVPAAKKVGPQFNIVETRELLRLVAAVKPIGWQGWSEVERLFNEKAGAGV